MNKNKVSFEFEADIATASVATPAGHVYSKIALEEAAKMFNGRIQKRGGVLHGELAMPSLNRVRDLHGRVRQEDTLYVDERNISHAYSNVRMEGDVMKISAVILDTPKGTFIKEFTARTEEGKQPVFGLRGAIPADGIDEDGTITKFLPISVDIVDFK